MIISRYLTSDIILELPLGKISLEALEKYVLGHNGIKSSEVILGPELGVDFGVIKINNQYLIISSDPVTGIEDEIGWYSVNISANDVVTSGAKPKFLTSVILLPDGSNSKILEGIIDQIDSASKNLDMTVLGGHTEVTPNLSRCIVIMTAFGFTNQYITAKGAKPGDAILMTKTAGIEGTSILARLLKNDLNRIDNRIIQDASSLISQISIIQESLEVFSTGCVNAMHDPTEGGILGGLYEMSIASNVGFKIKKENIPIAKPTTEICNKLNLDPLKLAGSGSLLAAIKPESIDLVIEKLRKINVLGSIIGRFEGKTRVTIRDNGSISKINGQITDELWKFIST